MKILLLCFSLILSLSSCVSMQDSSSVLYQEYSRYQESVSNDNILEEAGNFFSPSLLGKDYRANRDAIKQLLFKNYMVAEYRYHEKINQHDACLTVNGYDEENDPLIFSLKYIPRDGRWLIDKIHVVFIDNARDFADSAKCPHEYPE